MGTSLAIFLCFVQVFLKTCRFTRSRLHLLSTGTFIVSFSTLISINQLNGKRAGYHSYPNEKAYWISRNHTAPCWCWKTSAYHSYSVKNHSCLFLICIWDRVGHAMRNRNVSVCFLVGKSVGSSLPHWRLYPCIQSVQSLSFYSRFDQIWEFLLNAFLIPNSHFSCQKCSDMLSCVTAVSLYQEGPCDRSELFPAAWVK